MEKNDSRWVAGWGAAISYVSQNHADYFRDQTFRYVIFPTVDGSAVRLHFSNEYGTEPATVSKVVLAKRDRGEYIFPETNVRVTFGGSGEVTIPAGGNVVSDPAVFPVTAGEEFDVSLYFAGYTQLLTGHSNNGYYIKKYYGKGDWAEKACVPLEEYGENGPYVFLNTIDFLSSSDCHSVIAFGDSITAQPWPDCLAHRIYSLGIRNVSVIRKAIGGGRVLREYRFRIKKHFGAAGIRRFERDISQAGADRVFVLHGINDLIHPAPDSRICPMSELPTAEELKGGLGYYVSTARAHGMKIYLGTILPCPRCATGEGVREKIRLEVNDWIRNSSGCDGVIDFERAVWDPADHSRMLPEYDSGDHLHPSFAGAAHMAESIPVEFITG